LSLDDTDRHILAGTVIRASGFKLPCYVTSQILTSHTTTEMTDNFENTHKIL